MVLPDRPQENEGEHKITAREGAHAGEEAPLPSAE
jgi:hypothetical protein